MIEINMFYPVLFLLFAFMVFVFKELIYKHLRNIKEIFCKDKDSEIASKFLDKFPLVSQIFINKNIKEQNIENNQEIHELNKKLEDVSDVQNKILYILKNTNILQSMTLDEVKKGNG